MDGESLGPIERFMVSRGKDRYLPQLHSWALVVFILISKELNLRGKVKKSIQVESDIETNPSGTEPICCFKQLFGVEVFMHQSSKTAVQLTIKYQP